MGAGRRRKDDGELRMIWKVIGKRVDSAIREGTKGWNGNEERLEKTRACKESNREVHEQKIKCEVMKNENIRRKETEAWDKKTNLRLRPNALFPQLRIFQPLLHRLLHSYSPPHRSYNNPPKKASSYKKSFVKCMRYPRRLHIM
jgi:hypothetical protein